MKQHRSGLYRRSARSQGGTRSRHVVAAFRPRRTECPVGGSAFGIHLLIVCMLTAFSVSSTLAEDSTILGGYSSRNQDQPGNRQSSGRNGFVLREGTRVGPLTGRFVRTGQRWRFLPDTPGGALSDVSQLGSQGDEFQAFPFAADSQSVRRTTRIDSKTLRRRSTSSSTAYSVASVADQLASTGLTPVDGHVASPETTRQALSMVLVIENLMLQRVADAVEADSNELRWTITGLITEFRDENRLLLTTIQRAPLQSR